MFNPSDLLSNIKELPAMPNIIMRALNIMKDPDSSLKELGDMLSPTVGKSGVNHRLKKIVEIAETKRK